MRFEFLTRTRTHPVLHVLWTTMRAEEDCLWYRNFPTIFLQIFAIGFDAPLTAVPPPPLFCSWLQPTIFTQREGKRIRISQYPSSLQFAACIPLSTCNLVFDGYGSQMIRRGTPLGSGV